jgi:hypothetical protein
MALLKNYFQLFGIVCLLTLRFISNNTCLTYNDIYSGQSSDKSASDTPAWPMFYKDIGITAAWSSSVSFSTYEVKSLSRLNLPPLSLLKAGDVELNPGPPNSTSNSNADADPSSCDSDIYENLKSRGLHFLHINARSLIPKLSELRLITQQTRPAVLTITESWLDSSITNDEVKIDGYDIIRNDRNRQGGGVCTYVRNDIAYNLREDLVLADLKSIWIDILLPKTKPILFGTIYMPHKDPKFVNSLEKLLSEISLGQETYILGDFNICLLDPNSSEPVCKAYKSCLSSAGLKNLIKEPTRVTEETESLIDHVLVSDANRVSQSGVIHLGMSDHFMTFCTRKAAKVKFNSHNSIKIRSLKNYDIDSFRSLLANCDWSSVLNSDTVDTAWQKFKEVFVNVLDRVAPKREVRIKQRTEPWITPSILEKIRKRDKIRRQLKVNTPNVYYQDFTTLRNQIQREVKTAKASFFQNKLEESMGDPKKLWSHLKNLGYGSKANSKGKIVLDIEGKLCYDTLSVCEYINNFFISVASNLVSKLPAALNKYGTASNSFIQFYQNKGVSPGEFRLKPVEEDFILKELCSLNVLKGAGLDDLSPRFLKDGAAQIAPLITYIVNLSITTETVPDTLKTARITPLYKKKSKLDVSNYRPVSVLNCVSKILERSVYVQIEEYLASRDLIFQYQSGFRSGFSTETCLIYLTDFVKHQISQGNYVGMMLLDVQKAFDSVNHGILCEKLEAMGVSSGWFQSYLCNRKQLVCIDGIKSSLQTITCGVPQGSLLGPLLYLCYSNDMELSVQNKLLLYADDSVIIAYDRDPKAVANMLGSDLKSCNQWLIDNKLSLHVGKTECILFGTKAKLKLVPNFCVAYDDKEIESQDSINYLGVSIDNTLSGENMVNSVIKKVSNRLKFLHRHAHILNQKLRKNLSSALIQCHMDYCCTSWYSGITQKYKQKLQIAQNKIARYILKLSSRDHIGQTELNLLNLLKFNDRVKQLRLNHVFNILNSQGAAYLSQNFNKSSNVHSHRTRSSNTNFIVPRVKGIASSTFYYNAILDWNALPPNTKGLPTKYAFKRSVKQHLASNSLNQEMAVFTV